MRLGYLIGIISIGAGWFAYAHPHSFIDMKATWQVKDNTLTGVALTWQLDEMTSMSLTYDVFQRLPYPIAMKKIADELTHNVSGTHFFSHLSNRGKPIPFELKPGSAKARQRKLKTEYTFVLALRKPLPLHNIDARLATYEPTYFVRMAYRSPNDIDSSQLPKQCHSRLIEPNYDTDLTEYAQSLDEQATPMEDTRLGKQFSQEIQLQCH